MTRDSNLDTLRVAAAFAVVLLHVCAGVVNAGPTEHASGWWLADVIESATRWCVPVFVMVSGALLLGRPISSPREFYRRRGARLLVPLLAWSAVYAALSAYLSRDLEWTTVARAIMTEVPYYHLWYLYMLVGLYLVVPFLRAFVASASPALIGWFLIVGFALAVSDDVASRVPGGTAASIFVVRFLLYVPYLVAGHFLRGLPASAPPPRVLLLSIAGGCVAVIALLVGLLAPRLDHLSWEIMYSYLNPLVVLMSLCVFRIGITQPLRSARAIALVRRIAPLTLGVYLVHPLWLEGMRRVGLYGSALHPAFGIPVTALLAFGLSCFTTAALAKVPYLRATVR